MEKLVKAPHTVNTKAVPALIEALKNLEAEMTALNEVAERFGLKASKKLAAVS